MRLVVIIFLLSIGHILLAQQDSIASKTQKAKSKLEQKLDSVKIKKLDSLKNLNPIGQITDKADSLLTTGNNALDFVNNKMDSINNLNPLNKVTNKTDSVLNNVQSKIDAVEQKINSIPNALQNKIDSVKNKVNEGLQQAKDKIENKVDPATHKIVEVQNTITQGTEKKLNELENLGLSGVTEALPENTGLDKLNSITKTPDTEISKLTNIPEFKSDLPNADLPSLDLNTQEVNGDVPTLNSGEKKGSSQLSMSNLNLGNEQLSSVTDKLGEVNKIKNEAGGVMKELKDLKENGLANADTKSIEKKAFDLTGAGEADAKMKAAMKLKLENEQMVQKYRDKKLMEAELKRKMTNLANEKINSLSPEVKKVQSKLSKVKSIDPISKGIKDATTINKNEMKGKPFKQRLVPGLALQTSFGNVFSLDIAPQLGYRLSGRLTYGLGAQYRVSINKKYSYYLHDAGVYGARTYFDFRLLRSFYLHSEFEVLELKDRAVPVVLENAKHEVYSSHFGVGKQLNLSKRVSAYVLAFYRIEYSGHLPGVSKYNTRLVLNLRQQKKKNN